MTKFARLGILAALVAAALTGVWLDHAQAGARRAPFGDKVSAAILNYNRASPQIATSGKYGPAAVAEIKALGFAAVVDLRSQGENGTSEVGAAARAAGLKYLNIPVTTKAPTDDQVAAFAKIVADPANHPLLVSCASANRAGAMWALYRAAQGVDPKVAIEEGRAAGLEPNREQAVRERLGLPPLTD